MSAPINQAGAFDISPKTGLDEMGAVERAIVIIRKQPLNGRPNDDIMAKRHVRLRCFAFRVLMANPAPGRHALPQSLSR